MSDNGHHGIDQRKARWRAFLDMDQPSSHVFMIGYDPEAPERPLPWPDLKQERIEYAWRLYERQMARMEWLRDDSLPHLSPYTGTEIFAEAFGCSVYRPDDTMPFALPMISEAGQVAAIRVPKVSNTPLAMLFEIADELRRRAGDDALMKLVDIQSPMDIAALIWDKNAFYMALYDTPEAVRELAAKVKELLVAFQDAWFARYGQEFIAHYPSYYMPDGFTLSEDEVGIVSKDVFVDLFLRELIELSEHYGGLGVHCCAHAKHQWANFLRIPNLRLLNLVQPEDVLKQAWQFFGDRVPQMHSWSGEGPAWTWPAQYPEGTRMVLQVQANSRDEALELSDRLWQACGRD